MSERDELALELFIGDNANQPRESSVQDWIWFTVSGKNRGQVEHYKTMAEHALAAGYRKPRTITTREELDALFAGDANVVLLDEDGVVIQNLAGGWKTTGSQMFMHSDAAFRIYGPTFTVLHEATP